MKKELTNIELEIMRICWDKGKTSGRNIFDESIKKKVRKYKTAVLYITHNLRVLSEIADKVAIMYAGTIVERGMAKEIFFNPLHPYTKALIECLPEKGVLGERLNEISGQVPSIFGRTKKCKFQPRCSFSTEICREAPPPNLEASSSHFVLCHNASEVKKSGIT